MRTTGTYVIERTEVLRKAYRLLCIFFANKEIARRSAPDEDDAPLKALERLFLEADASRLLVEVAVAVRVLDDQMRRRPLGDPERVEHERGMAAVRKYEYGMFDDLNLDLRETCNKIIHSDVMEPHTKDGWEPHEWDLAHIHGDDDRSIDWEHLNGYVRLAGTKGKQEWYVLLDIEVFVSAVYEVVRPLGSESLAKAALALPATPGSAAPE
jgi:hypothetical protein